MDNKIKCPNCHAELELNVCDYEDSEDMTDEQMDKAMSKEMKSKNKLEEYD